MKWNPSSKLHWFFPWFLVKARQGKLFITSLATARALELAIVTDYVHVVNANIEYLIECLDVMWSVCFVC